MGGTPLSPPYSSSSFDESSDCESSNSSAKSIPMADKTHNRPWLDKDAVSILGDQHRFPKNPEKWILKCNPDDKIPMEDHIKSFMQAIRLRNVIHEDVVCILFPYTFEGKASTWYFSLEASSIPSWDVFSELFTQKFGDDKTPEELVIELSSMKTKGKERVKDYNHRFSYLKNRIPNHSTSC